MKIKLKDLKMIIREVSLGEPGPGSSEELMLSAGDDGQIARQAWASGDFDIAADAYQSAAKKLKQAADMFRSSGDEEYALDLEDEADDLLLKASDALERAGIA